MGSWLKSIKLNTSEMQKILYPRKFNTKEEVDFYTSGDVVTCLICDKSFKNLAKHLVSGHGCDAKEYRDILNIPRTKPLGSAEYVKKLSENSLHLFHNVLSEGQRDFLVNSVHNPNGVGGGNITSTIALEKMIMSARKKGKNRGMIHGRTQGKCHDCGCAMEISTQRVNRITKCEPCQKERRAKKAKEYQERNKEKIAKYNKEWHAKKTRIIKTTTGEIT